MPTNIRKLSNRLDELQLGSTNILSYKEIKDDDYRREYEFNTSTNRYTLILTQYPYDESSVDNNPWGYPEKTVLEIEFVTTNIKTGVQGDPITRTNVNKGEPELLSVYSTIADIVTDYVYEHNDIHQIRCYADPTKTRIYSNLIKSNLAKMLPEFKLISPLTLEKT